MASWPTGYIRPPFFAIAARDGPLETKKAPGKFLQGPCHKTYGWISARIFLLFMRFGSMASSRQRVLVLLRNQRSRPSKPFRHVASPSNARMCVQIRSKEERGRVEMTTAQPAKSTRQRVLFERTERSTSKSCRFIEHASTLAAFFEQNAAMCTIGLRCHH